jgi:hypothetical protein
MNNKKTLIIAAVAVLVVLSIIAAFLAGQKKATVQAPVIVQAPMQTAAPTSEAPQAEVVKDQFRAEVPVNIKVPELSEVLTVEQKKEIAVPTIVTPAAPGSSAQFRNFNIIAEGGKYTPLKVIGRVGDTIHINFTAVDKDYDIVFPSYNMKTTALKGQTKILEFQAIQEGNFTYYCEMCGGPDGPTKGNIILTK